MIITCPPAVVLTATNTCSVSVLPSFMAYVSTKCGFDVSFVLPMTTAYGVGVFPITLSYVDIDKSTKSCLTSITVTDKSPGTITCPTSPLIATASSGCKANLPPGYVATAISKCGTNLGPVKATKTTGYGLGKTTATFSVVDLSGKTISCSTLVQVEDEDPDGVCGTDDMCPGTSISNEVKSTYLKKNSYVASGRLSATNGFSFKSTSTSNYAYTTKDTGGCTCSQIIAKCGYNQVYLQYGCPKEMMDAWTGKYSQVGKRKYSCLAKYKLTVRGSKGGRL
jgi:hypothetical protein